MHSQEHTFISSQPCLKFPTLFVFVSSCKYMSCLVIAVQVAALVYICIVYTSDYINFQHGSYITLDFPLLANQSAWIAQAFVDCKH